MSRKHVPLQSWPGSSSASRNAFCSLLSLARHACTLDVRKFSSYLEVVKGLEEAAQAGSSMTCQEMHYHATTTQNDMVAENERSERLPMSDTLKETTLVDTELRAAALALWNSTAAAMPTSSDVSTPAKVPLTTPESSSKSSLAATVVSTAESTTKLATDASYDGPISRKDASYDGPISMTAFDFSTTSSFGPPMIPLPGSTFDLSTDASYATQTSSTDLNFSSTASFGPPMIPLSDSTFTLSPDASYAAQNSVITPASVSKSSFASPLIRMPGTTFALTPSASYSPQISLNASERSTTVLLAASMISIPETTFRATPDTSNSAQFSSIAPESSSTVTLTSAADPLFWNMAQSYSAQNPPGGLQSLMTPSSSSSHVSQSGMGTFAITTDPFLQQIDPSMTQAILRTPLVPIPAPLYSSQPPPGCWILSLVYAEILSDGRIVLVSDMFRVLKENAKGPLSLACYLFYFTRQTKSTHDGRRICQAMLSDISPDLGLSITKNTQGSLQIGLLHGELAFNVTRGARMDWNVSTKKRKRSGKTPSSS
ncbi:hypothetical protein CF326_g9130 [Tilletia indica]|nr:hypothetical protein CF326_g9130 [Tilletia indica]